LHRHRSCSGDGAQTRTSHGPNRIYEPHRIITIGSHETRLVAARAQQADPEWVADYRATRPKVERKIAHLMRRRHGGRKARMRGITKIGADFRLLAAAGNLARLAILAA
jgi:hypothetical protein